MEFIADNFIWIIIVLVVILMTIIGYIADKTDFGKNKAEKPVKEKKVKEKKVKEKKNKKDKAKEIIEPVEEITSEQPTVGDINVDELPKNEVDIMNDFPMETEEYKEEAQPAFDTDEMDLNPKVDDDFMAEVNNDSVKEVEDASSQAELNPFETFVSDEVPVEETTPITEENNQPAESPVPELNPFEGIMPEETNVVNEVPVENTTSETEEKVSNDLLGDQKDDLEIELPSIDSLNKELEDDAEDDDVWKF